MNGPRVVSRPATPRRTPAPAAGVRPAARPRIGFLGAGWIGRNRLESLATSGVAHVAAVADPDPDAVARATGLVPDAATADSIAALLEVPLDGIVIATPSALHAEQARLVLERGLAVFCQKPLGRTAAETKAVVDAARAADRPLGIDFCYREVRGMRALRDLARSGGLGRVFAIDLVFHNAYGPDKPWFRDARLSGGGCVIDLGIHLLDLALWVLDWPDPTAVSSRLRSRGRPIAEAGAGAVEDHAVAQIETATGTTIRLACSWNLHAGRDAVIEAAFHGTDGGAALRNIEGSFYDFVVERYDGTAREIIAAPPDAWGGRAIVEWARRLAAGSGFDEAAARAVDVAAAIDRIYQR